MKKAEGHRHQEQWRRHLTFLLVPPRETAGDSIQWNRGSKPSIESPSTPSLLLMNPFKALPHLRFHESRGNHPRQSESSTKIDSSTVSTHCMAIEIVGVSNLESLLFSSERHAFSATALGSTSHQCISTSRMVVPLHMRLSSPTC